MDIKELAKESHERSLSKGWWKEYDAKYTYFAQEEAPLFLATKLALVGCEVSESLEELRRGRIEMEVIDGKPEGVVVELADTILRILDFTEHLGLDIEGALRAKLDFNKTRPIKHGGKLF